MGFGAQRIANTYADWTKVRKRIDSTGQRLYSPFGEAIDKEIINLKILKESLKVNKKALGTPYLYEYILTPDEEILYIENGTRSYYSFPIISEINDYSINEVARFSAWESFINALPEKYNEASTKERASNLDLLWNNTVNEIKEIIRPEHLGVVVKNSTQYKTGNIETDNGEPFNRHSCIIIKGLNEDFIEIEEYITVFRDGYFETKNVFRTISEIDYDGFDGEINIFLGRKTNASFFRKRYPYAIGASSSLEGPIDIEIVRDENNFGFLTTYLIRSLFGYEHLDGTGETNSELLQEIIAEQLLLDESGTPIVVVDYFISPINAKIYVLSLDSTIHIFEYKLSEFKKSNWNETNKSVLRLNCSESQRVGLGDSEYLFTEFLNKQFRIKSVTIKVKDPNGGIFYLQADHTFSSSLFSFSGVDYPIGEKTWNDLLFKFNFSILGQYDFNILTTVRDIDEVFISNISMICESNTAIKSYKINYPDLTNIFLTKKNEICVENSTNKYYLKGEVEGFFGDFINQRLIFRKEYDFIRVIGHE